MSIREKLARRGAHVAPGIKVKPKKKVARELPAVKKFIDMLTAEMMKLPPAEREKRLRASDKVIASLKRKRVREVPRRSNPRGGLRSKAKGRKT